MTDSLFNWFGDPNQLRNATSRPQEAVDEQRPEANNGPGLEFYDIMDPSYAVGDPDRSNRDPRPQTSPSSSASSALQAIDAFRPPSTSQSPSKLSDKVSAGSWEAQEPPMLVHDDAGDLSRETFDIFLPTDNLPLLTTGPVPTLQPQRWPCVELDTTQRSSRGVRSASQSSNLETSLFGIHCPWNLVKEL